MPQENWLETPVRHMFRKKNIEVSHISYTLYMISYQFMHLHPRQILEISLASQTIKELNIRLLWNCNHDGRYRSLRLCRYPLPNIIILKRRERCKQSAGTGRAVDQAHHGTGPRQDGCDKLEHQSDVHQRIYCNDHKGTVQSVHARLQMFKT